MARCCFWSQNQEEWKKSFIVSYDRLLVVYTTLQRESCYDVPLLQSLQSLLLCDTVVEQVTLSYMYTCHCLTFFKFFYLGISSSLQHTARRLLWWNPVFWTSIIFSRWMWFAGDAILRWRVLYEQAATPARKWPPVHYWHKTTPPHPFLHAAYFCFSCVFISLLQVAGVIFKESSFLEQVRILCNFNSHWSVVAAPLDERSYSHHPRAILLSSFLMEHRGSSIYVVWGHAHHPTPRKFEFQAFLGCMWNLLGLDAIVWLAS